MKKKKVKVVIAGSRNIDDYEIVKKAIEQVVEENNLKIELVISGAAKGVDKLGEEWAEENDIPIKSVKPDWKDLKVKGARVCENKYGKYNANAGHDRNKIMAEHACILIAITTGTPGTENMIKNMKLLKKPVYIHEVENDDIYSYDF